MALNRSPEFCLKLIYRHRLKADHVPGTYNTWSEATFGDATYQISRLYSMPYGFRQGDFFHVSLYKPL